MEVIIAKLVASLIKPPGLMLGMMLLGSLLRHRFYRTGQGFIYAGIFLLVLFSLPVVSGGLVRWYEDMPALDETTLKQTSAQAIVVLAGGRNTNAPEYQQDTVSQFSLVRLRYAAYLQRQSKLPILATGGRVYGDESISEAELIQQALQNEFNAQVRWVEDKSRTTFENAVDTQTLLASENINHILLVTHAMHMPRAKEAFKQAGFTVTAAPTGFHTRSSGTFIGGLLPSANALYLSNALFHEWLGRLWYRLRYY
jgi:uncharacterized SAM-binding protein YcdF (DUF218 family)